MGFSGDLKDIDLTNIFQTLGMNQHEGILKVSDSQRLAQIYFSKQGIRLLVDDAKPYSLLGELLLRKKLVGEGDLRRALKFQKESGKRMGEILVEHGMLSAEDLAKVLREQMEEKIYEIFSWKHARFEFEAGALAPDDPFFSDGKREEEYLTFNINSIMMEAARRIDEWGLINQSIPRRSEVLRLIHPSAEVANYEYGLPKEDVGAVVGLVNGHRPVSRIILESGLGNFRTCKILKALIDEGHAELIPTSDLLRLANSFMSAGRLQDGIEAFQTAIARTPDDVELRQRLAEAALDRGAAKVAADEYRAIGEIFEKAGERRKALQSYTTAVELDRSDVKIHERLFELYGALREKHLALEEGRLLAKLHMDRKNHAKAESILLKIKEDHVLDVGVMKLLVKIYLDRKEKAKAIAELESLAQSCEVKKRYAESEEAYQTILRLDRNRKDIEQRAAKVAGRMHRGAGPKIALRFVLGIVLLGLVGAGGWFIATELRKGLAARRGIEEIAAGVRGLQEPTKIQDEEEIEAAIRETREWLGRVTSLTEQVGADEDLQGLRSTLEDREANLVAKVDALRGEVKDKNYRTLAEAKEWLAKGDLARALAAAREVVESPHNYPSTLLDGKQLVEEIERRQEGAAKLLMAAQDADRAELYSEAYKLYNRLLQRYPHSDSVAHVSLPLFLVTDPPGATVLSEGTPLGVTPWVFRYGPDDHWTISFELPGYETLEVERRWVPDTEREAARLERKMTKKFEWSLDLGSKAKIVADLVSAAGTVFVPTMDGRVIFVLPGDRKDRPGISTGMLGAIPAPGLLHNGVLYMGSKNSTVVAIQTRTGDKLWEQKLGDFPEKVITSPAISADGRVLLVAGGKVLFALDALDPGNREPIWKLEFDRDIETAPLVVGEVALVHRPGTRDLLRIRVSDKGEAGPAFTLPDEPVGPLHQVGEGLIAFAGSSGRVMAIHSETGAPVWSSGELGRIRGTEPIGERIWVSVDGGVVLALAVANGDESWRLKIEGPGDAVSAARIDETVYFGTDGGSALAVDVESGRVVWTLSIPSAVVAAPCMEGGMLFFGCLDGKIYAVLP